MSRVQVVLPDDLGEVGLTDREGLALQERVGAAPGRRVDDEHRSGERDRDDDDRHDEFDQALPLTPGLPSRRRQRQGARTSCPVSPIALDRDRGRVPRRRGGALQVVRARGRRRASDRVEDDRIDIARHRHARSQAHVEGGGVRYGIDDVAGECAATAARTMGQAIAARFEVDLDGATGGGRELARVAQIGDRLAMGTRRRQLGNGQESRRGRDREDPDDRDHHDRLDEREASRIACASCGPRCECSCPDLGGP